MEANLRYFDARSISWTAYVYEPGKLITGYRYQDATTLESGWTCGQPDSPQAGPGQVVQFHLWSGPIRAPFVTSEAGSFQLPRDAVVTLYGAIFAERDSRSAGPLLPTSLGKVSVQVTDRLGKARLGGLRYASAGWNQVDFVVPPESAPGRAQIAILRDDGTGNTINTTIVAVAPALVTVFENSHGPASGLVIQTLGGGRRRTSPSYRCSSSECRTVPIPLSRNGSTRLRVRASGLRNAVSAADIQVKVGGRPVPVVGFGPDGEPGVDYLTVQLPSDLRRLGETDIIASVQGRLSNVALVHIGGLEAAAAAPVISYGAASHGEEPNEVPYRWDLPKGPPRPRVPPDNPMLAAKVQLGRHLFL